MQWEEMKTQIYQIEQKKSSPNIISRKTKLTDDAAVVSKQW